jgi:hypothetical protein
MSIWHDHIDWIGGYPFEVATPAAITSFYGERGYTLVNSKLSSSQGCNEFVFVKNA